jgi:DNA oxidative demethylase
VKGPPPSAAPRSGDAAVAEPGFSYLPRFIEAEEGVELAAFFAGLRPLWEQRHAPGSPSRRGGASRLTRPVYWLGAWQFAALGYYAEPDHQRDRCLRAEPFPEVMTRILLRLRPELARHGGPDALPNTCLVNYYGRERPPDGGPPIDTARLGMHRDQEPGPVVMFSIGQPAQFEFVEPDAPEPRRSQWLADRSVVLLSGPVYKDHLYHRVTRVRHGEAPTLNTSLPGFEVRRVSVSFRYVPERWVHDLGDLGPEAQAVALPYVRALAVHSAHFARQLGTVSGGP